MPRSDIDRIREKIRLRQYDMSAVTGNILHCLRNGSQLGWLIDPSERSILVYQPNCLPDLLAGKDITSVRRF